MLKSIAQSVIQDAATAGAGWLAAHGYLQGNQEQAFIGSIVFLAMLGVNAYLQHTQTKAAQP
jgi:hypothetical protein